MSKHLHLFFIVHFFELIFIFMPLCGMEEQNDRVLSLSYEKKDPTQFFSEISSYPNLTELSLAFTQPKDEQLHKLTQLSQLQFLDLYGNKFISIPHVVSTLTKLKCLDLGKNNIQTLIPGLTKLSCLEFLSLNNNPLRSVDCRFLPKKLRTFMLSYCKLQKIPSYIHRMTRLQQLHLDGNAIKELDCNNLPQSIEQVVLDHNRISITIKNPRTLFLGR